MKFGTAKNEFFSFITYRLEKSMSVRYARTPSHNRNRVSNPANSITCQSGLFPKHLSSDTVRMTGMPLLSNDIQANMLQDEVAKTVLQSY